jgi:hypothetical protein
VVELARKEVLVCGEQIDVVGGSGGVFEKAEIRADLICRAAFANNISR